MLFSEFMIHDIVIWHADEVITVYFFFRVIKAANVIFRGTCIEFLYVRNKGVRDLLIRNIVGEIVALFLLFQFLTNNLLFIAIFILQSIIDA